MSTLRPLTVAASITFVALLVAYLGSYAALVQRTKLPGIGCYAPTYRFSDGMAVHNFFLPAHALDYWWLRQDYWYEEIEDE